MIDDLQFVSVKRKLLSDSFSGVFFSDPYGFTLHVEKRESKKLSDLRSFQLSLSMESDEFFELCTESCHQVDDNFLLRE